MIRIRRLAFAALSVALATVLVFAGSGVDTPSNPQTTTATDLVPTLIQAGGVAEIVNAPVLADYGNRATVPLYTGLQPSGNFIWHFTSGGGGEVSYWALDDGQMGPGAVAVGGGHVTAYEFSIGVHSDFDGDVIQPYVIVNFYNAPADPVGSATNPVVEPPAPVSSIAWLFNPIGPLNQGFYWYRSGLIDLAAAGTDTFNLDDSYYVEVIPLEWNGATAVIDPDVFAVFGGPGTVTYGTNNSNHMWSDWFFRNSAGTIVSGNNDFIYDHPAELDYSIGNFFSQSAINIVGLECDHPNSLILSIDEPADICVQPGETVTVTLSQECLAQLVRGYQAFLEFDPAALTFVSGTYITPMPYGLPILTPITASGAEIDLAAGIDDLGGQIPTSSTADLAVLTFTAGALDGPTQVSFRTHAPPTRFSDEIGQEIVPLLFDSPSICVDGMAPSMTCPADLDLQCLADVPPPATDYAEFVTAGGTASDSGCYSAVTVAHVGDTTSGTGCPSDPYVVTRTYRATDCAGNTNDCVQTITVIDNTAPTITYCPPAIDVPAEAGECVANINPGVATATDNCDMTPTVVGTRSDSLPLTDPYPATGYGGPVTITWTATDDCGNSSQCSQLITVQPVNELVLNIRLGGSIVAGPITRCITFDLWDCTGPTSVTHTEEISFSGGSASLTIDVPCGQYECATARDTLHTLRRRDESFNIVGTQYVADFTGDPGAGGDWLIGGNLNDDYWIDILDFGRLSANWNISYGTGNTTCSTPPTHADINGDGLVNSADFSFIQINFLKGNEWNCCGQPLMPIPAPVLDVTIPELRERGMGELAAGDLNRDGRLNQEDMVAFMQGARPAPQPKEVEPMQHRAIGPGLP